MTSFTKIAWTEHDIKDVMDYFVKGFQIKEGAVASHDFFLDARKGRVVFKLMVDTSKPNEPPSRS